MGDGGGFDVWVMGEGLMCAYDVQYCRRGTNHILNLREFLLLA